MQDDHKLFISKRVVLSTDYKAYGGKVKRWEYEDNLYPDCSVGCKWARWLEGDLGADWLVCANQNSPRAGLLTFEHQAGFDCFEYEKEVDE